MENCKFLSFSAFNMHCVYAALLWVLKCNLTGQQGEWGWFTTSFLSGPCVENINSWLAVPWLPLGHDLWAVAV